MLALATRWRIIGAAVLLIAASFSPAHAHGKKGGAGQGSIEPVLDALPEALAGLRIQIHESLAPQLAVENRSSSSLEVLDELAAPFLRIGPAGVEANLASPTWYRSASPSDAVPTPKDVAAAGAAGESLPPRWRLVSREPSWGWFDRRIEAVEVEAPHGVAEAGLRAEVGRWRIPVRLDESELALTGAFVFVPAARGVLRLRLTGDRELAPGVKISILSGRGGSFFLRSDSPEPVTLIGREGEPFLRLSPEGVEANRRSPTFADVASLRGGADLVLEGGEGEGPAWLRVSRAPRYAWVDPRPFVDVPAAVAAGTRAVRLASWSLPVHIGTGVDVRSVNIEGATWWEPIPGTDPKQEKP